MCLHMKFPDGSSAIICGTRGPRKYCACGRAADLLCDWKVSGKKSGTCDKPICKSHALNVAPDRDLCSEHQKAFESWKRAHPGVNVNELRQKALGLEPVNQQDLFHV